MGTAGGDGQSLMGCGGDRGSNDVDRVGMGQHMAMKFITVSFSTYDCPVNLQAERETEYKQ